jgi:flavin reductase (DIM6/NTAB) family NADH-FMN oxidoreductase RutF
MSDPRERRLVRLWPECTVERSRPAGDHDIIPLRVLAMMTDDERNPVVRHRQTFKMPGS